MWTFRMCLGDNIAVVSVDFELIQGKIQHFSFSYQFGCLSFFKWFAY